jgi:hypothetical protein
LPLHTQLDATAVQEEARLLHLSAQLLQENSPVVVVLLATTMKNPVSQLSQSLPV